MAVTLEGKPKAISLSYFGIDPLELSDFSRNRSYPEHTSTGSRGYFGKLGFVAENWH
jgi:hypothetical protein